MAELNTIYYTTIKIGDNAYLTWGWKVLGYGSTLKVMRSDIDEISGDIIIKTGEYSLKYVNELKIQVVSGDITGEGYIYEPYNDSTKQYTFFSSTCSDVNNTSTVGENWGLRALFKDNNIKIEDVNKYIDSVDVYSCIDEIEVSKNIVNIPYSMFTGYFSLNTLLINGYYFKTNIIAKQLNLSNNIKVLGDTNNYYSGIFDAIGVVKINVDNIQILGGGAIKNNVYIEGEFNNLKKIYSQAFFENNRIEYLSIPKNLEYIGQNAFFNCKKLKDINENNYMNCECTLAFGYCPNIEVITLGDNAKLTKHYRGYYYPPITFPSLNYSNNCDEQGYNIVKIITNITEYKTEKYNINGSSSKFGGTDYLGYYVKIDAVVQGTDLINIQAGSNKIVIKSYNEGDLELAIGSVIKKVKIVELTDANASPVHIAWGNKVMALSY